MQVKLNWRNIGIVAGALAVVLLLIFLPSGKERGAGSGKRVKGINRVLVNEMSEIPELSGLDKDIVRFMQRWYVKGMQLSITKNGALVYSKGYGWADREKEQRMGPGNILRVASVSKLITAAGVMKLCEQGRLSLQDKVFGTGGILDDVEFSSAISDKNYYRITVEDLLRHEAGLSIRRGDPLFTTRDLMHIYHLKKAPDSNELVRIAVQRRLGYVPGKSYEYSNLGYLLLSMIIERKGGEPYEQWIQDNVLSPAGCEDMHLAYNYYKDKYPNEVRYYMQDNDPLVPEYNNSGDSVARCYGGNNIRALQGAGAWVASSAELARFVASIDGNPGVPDILSKRSVHRMTESSDAHKFSLGWNTTDPDQGWIRTGSLSGTNALVYRFPDGECWILITNTHAWKGPKFSRYLRDLVKECKKKYSDGLPSRNLFLQK